MRTAVPGLALLALASVTGVSAGSPEGGPPEPAARLRGLQRPVRDWAYQLQGIDPAELAASRFDVLAIDYARDGDEATELSAAQVRRMRENGPCGGHTVLAYLSVGEAESYRYYFDPAWLDDDGQPGPDAPSFLGPTNPEWEGNYKVRYWMRSWQQLLFGTATGPDRSYLDRILDAGFDGVYLDVIDAYEFWGPGAIGGNGERPRAAGDMVTLVRRLAHYARVTRGVPDFLVVPQNGAGIIGPEAHGYADDPEAAARRQRRRYFRQIDGIGAEDTFFYGPRDENNRYRPQRFTIRLLDRFLAAGKPVLAIDYLTRPAKVDRFWSLAREHGYTPYASVRDLQRLVFPPGHLPTCD